MKGKGTFAVLLIGLIGLLLIAKPTAAGGWVVITLDALPGPVSAGEGVDIGFMVRQHGQTPADDLSPVLSARNAATGETISAEAVQAGEPGHYQATLVFPEAGDWEWQISAEPFPQRVQFEPITVTPGLILQPAGEVQAEIVSGPFSFSDGARDVVRLLGLVLVSAALMMSLLRHKGSRRFVAPDTTR